MRAVPQVFIDDVFAKPVDVLSAEPSVEVECTLDTSVALAGQGMLTVEILDPDDRRRLGSATAVPVAASAGRFTVQLRIWELSEFTLWDIHQPKLYDVVTTLVWNGQALHQHRIRIGFRDARFDAEGFFLNGRRVKLFGVNRHQHYPFAGFAMSDRVQRRDAEILRATSIATWCDVRTTRSRPRFWTLVTSWACWCGRNRRAGSTWAMTRGANSPAAMSRRWSGATGTGLRLSSGRLG